MKKQEEKTNVMRLFDGAGIGYTGYCYLESGALSGTDVAAALGKNPDMLFKTLVTVGASGKNYVFVIPSSCELSLKKAASVSGEKNIEMIKSKELLPLTGYIHGGCSPVGMKKSFPTFVDETAQLWERIIFSGGKIGFMVETEPDSLKKMISFEYADLTV